MEQTHGQILKTGHSNDTYLITYLLSLYAKNHLVSDATHLLNSITDPGILSFSTLISSCSISRHFSEALLLFRQMLNHGILPDNVVTLRALKACARLFALKIW